MNDEITVWLDMDGVLVGFDAGYRIISKGMDFDEYANKYGQLAAERHFQIRGHEFWENLGWEHGGEEVYNTSKKLYRDVRILSSSGTQVEGPKHEEVKKGKLLWIKKHNLIFSEVIIVSNRHDKQKYATPMSILVDDLNSNIQEWNRNGGTGILHNSNHYKETLVELEEYSKPLSFSEIAKRAAHLM